MPIYAYRCGACGHAKDVLQKMSDSPLTTCPACGAEAFSKQVTAAGFQLKGSGWYVTDFRGGSAGAGSAPAAGAASAATGGAASTATSDAGAASSPAPSASTSAPSGDGGGTAGGCGTSCACH
ncbi:MAG: zinc ribbon domain-containing protein [Burkholderiales bacterium]|nr:zinc ribbon domain-containing protein [Burkholderiales bacterium]